MSIVKQHGRVIARTGVLTSLVSLALAAPALAAKPTVTTGGTQNLTPTSATLKAAVNPKGKGTLYYFQYGTSKAYGSATPEVGAGEGNGGVSVQASVVGLAANKNYHYRVVARNSDGTTVGGDKSFKTPKQPLGFTLEASPNPAPFLGAVTLQGVLSGTGNSGRAIVLQQNVFPFTAGFQNVGNPQVTGSTGSFAFPILSVSTNAQYRVVTTAGGKVTSSVVTLGVAVDVSTDISGSKVKRGRHVRFKGKVHPAKRGAIYQVQRKTDKGNWIRVADGTSTGGGSTFSRYEKLVRIRYSGLYRVVVGVADGYQVTGIGREVKITATKK
jgi:hypothetical protein